MPSEVTFECAYFIGDLIEVQSLASSNFFHCIFYFLRTQQFPITPPQVIPMAHMTGVPH